MEYTCNLMRKHYDEMGGTVLDRFMGCFTYQLHCFLYPSLLGLMSSSAKWDDNTPFFLSFFFMWTVCKDLIEFVTILPLFYVSVSWWRGMWDFSS